jgi:hypothetical protein
MRYLNCYRPGPKLNLSRSSRLLHPWKGHGVRAYDQAMDNDVHSLPADQIGEALGAEVKKQRLDLRGKSVAEIASILTSPPIGRDYGIDEPLAHAPPVAPLSSPVAPDLSRLTHAPPIIPQIAHAPPMAWGVAGPKQRLDLRGKSVAEIVFILTSPPVGREDGIDDPLAHARPVAPPSSAVAPDSSRLANALPIIPQIANAPPMAPGIAGPNLDLPPLKSRPAEEEIAVEGLRAPRSSHDQGPVVARVGRLSFVVILAAIVAIGVTLTTFSNEVRERLGDIFGMVAPLFEEPSRARTLTKLPRLVVKSSNGFRQRTASTGRFDQRSVWQREAVSRGSCHRNQPIDG